MMTTSFKLKFLSAAVSTVLLAGCGDAETTIVEQAPIEDSHDDHDHDHDHGGDHDGAHDDGDITIESLGRLAVLSADSPSMTILDLDDGQALDTFSLMHTSNALYASADYRYAVVNSRSQDYVGFVDGGLWREDHVAHLHDYEQAPMMSDFTLSGSQPTHVDSYASQMAIFFDGNADAGLPAQVQVVTDAAIASEATQIPTLNYSVNMHGVAKPREDYLLATVRRDDSENTSDNKILPDQVGVFHLHDGVYEQEQVLDVTCPNLHGAAQNDTHVVFGCSDGVLVAHEHDGEYEAEKIANIEAVGDLRVGSVYGDAHSTSFIGVASGHGGGAAVLVNIDPQANSMEALEWQPASDASPVAYSFAHGGEHFLVLDSQGYLNILSAHAHDDETHWELETRLDITEQDVSAMPEDASFSMTVAQNGHYVYVADPLAQHVLQIDLETQTISGDMELDFAPDSLTWLGIAESEHHHD